MTYYQIEQDLTADELVVLNRLAHGPAPTSLPIPLQPFVVATLFAYYYGQLPQWSFTTVWLFELITSSISIITTIVFLAMLFDFDEKVSSMRPECPADDKVELIKKTRFLFVRRSKISLPRPVHNLFVLATVIGLLANGSILVAVLCFGAYCMSHLSYYAGRDTSIKIIKRVA